MEQKVMDLIDHIIAMSNDDYLCGHPEWYAIVDEAIVLRDRSKEA